MVENYGAYACTWRGALYSYSKCNCLLPVFSKEEAAAMPGRGGKGGAGLKPKKHFKAKQQKKRVFRSKDPILAVLMWGVQHSVRKIAISAYIIIHVHVCYVQVTIKYCHSHLLSMCYSTCKLLQD